MAETPRSANFAAVFAAVALAAVAGGVAGAHFGFLSPQSGLYLFGAGLLAGGLLALVFGIFGLKASHAGSPRGRPRALAGAATGAALLGLLTALAIPAARYPAIHDLTTDPEDPPELSGAARHPDNADRDLTYPHGGAAVPTLQRQAYPDLKPIVLASSREESFAATRRAAAQLGWTITWDNPSLGVLEATDTSRLFRFVDDIAVRVRASASGSIVDVRSTSRVGDSDLGANAARIRAFRDLLQASDR